MVGNYDVFVSYSRRDGQAYAGELIRALRETGIRVVADQSLGLGHEIPRALEDALSTSSTIVLLVTPASATSEWTRTEITNALRNHKSIVPVVLDKTALDSPIGSLLGDRLFVDASDLTPSAAAYEVVHRLDRTILESSKLRRRTRRAVIAGIMCGLSLFAMVSFLAVRAKQERLLLAQTAERARRQAEEIQRLQREAEQAKTQAAHAYEATQYVNTGVRYYHRRQYARAIESYDRALALDPTNAYVLDLKGYSQFKLAELQSAIESLRQSVTLQPSFAWGHFDLARVYCAAGNFFDANNAISSALNADLKIKNEMKKDGEFTRLCRPLESRYR